MRQAIAALSAVLALDFQQTGMVIAADAAPSTHVIIRNATIYDGTGQPGFRGDLHIQGERIIAVGKVGKVENAREIDASGLIVCPGFIDLHTHCDTGSPNLTSPEGAANKNYVLQGCTTVVTGNCGSGPVDTGKFYATLEKQGVGTNVVHQAPHNSIRSAVMGNQNRPPTDAELKRMEELVDKAMRDGAWGLATGLIYNPGTYSQTDELIALAKVVNRYQGHYASHIRNEGTGLLDAIEEALRIGRESGCAVHISHIKASGRAAWGSSSRAVGLIEEARKKGQQVTADQYPYIASSTSLQATVVPARYREGSGADFLKRLDDPVIGPKLIAEIKERLERDAGPERLKVASFAAKGDWVGKTIAAIAALEKKEPIDIVLEIERKGGAAVVNFGMSEEDVRVFMKQPWVATASDGRVQDPRSKTVPHPRSYGTFPRKIGYYALEEKLIPLEQAIRSASGLPADILRMRDRGYLKPGYYADVVVFDPTGYRDAATFDDPHQYAKGVRWVFINGHVAVEGGAFQEAVRAGRPLRHKPTP